MANLINKDCCLKEEEKRVDELKLDVVEEKVKVVALDCGGEDGDNGSDKSNDGDRVVNCKAEEEECAEGWVML